jgi:hypothetical protein
MKPNYLKKIIVLLATFYAADFAFAQYVWLDEHGAKQYSDVAPPSSVPSDHILKQPRGSSKEMPTATAADSSDAAADKAPMTTAEANADFNKRKLEQAAKDKKADDEAKQAATKAENCARNIGYLNTLKSNGPIASTNSNGERTLMSDDDRAKEIARAQSATEDCQ